MALDTSAVSSVRLSQEGEEEENNNSSLQKRNDDDDEETASTYDDSLSSSTSFSPTGAAAAAAPPSELEQSRNVRVLLSRPNCTLGFQSAHTLINKERKLRGRPKLHRSVVLDRICQARAEFLAQEQELLHSASSLQELKTLVQSEQCGENIQRGTSVYDMHQEFMMLQQQQPKKRNSHLSRSKDNILGRKFKEFGVGTAKGEDGKLYMVQLFRGDQHKTSC